MMGIEPTSPAWKARVIAIIRHPQGSQGLRFDYFKSVAIQKKKVKIQGKENHLLRCEVYLEATLEIG